MFINQNDSKCHIVIISTKAEVCDIDLLVS